MQPAGKQAFHPLGMILWLASDESFSTVSDYSNSDICTDFLVWISQLLLESEKYSVVIMDGAVLDWDDKRNRHSAVLHGLVQNFPQIRFILVSARDVSSFKFSNYPNFHQAADMEVATKVVYRKSRRKLD